MSTERALSILTDRGLSAPSDGLVEPVLGFLGPHPEQVYERLRASNPGKELLSLAPSFYGSVIFVEAAAEESAGSQPGQDLEQGVGKGLEIDLVALGPASPERMLLDGSRPMIRNLVELLPEGPIGISAEPERLGLSRVRHVIDRSTVGQLPRNLLVLPASADGQVDEPLDIVGLPAVARTLTAWLLGSSALRSTGRLANSTVRPWHDVSFVVVEGQSTVREVAPVLRTNARWLVVRLGRGPGSHDGNSIVLPVMAAENQLASIIRSSADQAVADALGHLVPVDDQLVNLPLAFLPPDRLGPAALVDQDGFVQAVVTRLTAEELEIDRAPTAAVFGPEDSGATVTRLTQQRIQTSVPLEIPAGQEAEVVVAISGPKASSRLASAGPPATPEVSAVGELLVHIFTAGSLSVVGEHIYKRVPVQAERHTCEVSFQVRAGDLPGSSGTVELRVVQNGTQVLAFDPVSVEVGGQLTAGGAAMVTEIDTLPLDVAPGGGAYLRIRHTGRLDSKGRDLLEFTLQTPGGDLITRQRGLLGSLVTDSRSQMGAKYPRQEQPSSRLEDVFLDLCARLGEQILPPDIVDGLRGFRLGGAPLILDDSEQLFPVPWELLGFHHPDCGGRPSLLGQHNLVRSHRDGTWADQITAKKKFVLQPGYRRRILPWAKEERQYLEHHFKFEGVDGVEAEPLLKKGNFDLFHFAGHGYRSFLQQGLVLFGGGIEWNLDAQKLSNLNLRNSPFVFLNACQSGGPNLGADGEPSGLSHRFMAGGASAFVGFQTDAPDLPAKEVATSLYEVMLNEGLPLADAIGQLRRTGPPRKRLAALWYEVVSKNPRLRLVK